MSTAAILHPSPLDRSGHDVTLKERGSERRKSFLKARIRYLHSNMTIDCIVRDISSTGAKLEIGSPLSLPAEFELEVPHRSKLLQCQVQWRKDDALGVRFKGNVNANAAPPDARDARIEALERENSELRLEIGRLMSLLAH